MKFPTVSKCCCCVELKTAGIILGVLGIVTSVLQIFKGAGIVSSLIGIAISGLWIYGIRAERTSFMLPTIILGVIGLVILYLLPLIVILLVCLLPNNKEVQQFKQAEYIIISIIVYIIAVVLATYFWIVEYSVYRHIKETTEERERSGNTIPHHEVPLKHEV